MTEATQKPEIKEFEAGALAHCNRCGKPSLTPKPCKCVKENAHSYRLTTMCTLACGHLDSHWVYV